MPSIDTQSLSDKHDKIFNKTIGGLGSARTKLLGLGEKITEKTPAKAVEKLPDSDVVINKSFDLLEKGLNKQHDWVEGLLAKGREESEVEKAEDVVADVADAAEDVVEDLQEKVEEAVSPE